MLEQELHWERNLFFFLNGSNSVSADHFFYLYSCMWTWIPFYLCFLFVFVYKKHWKEIVWILLSVALLVLLCDQISSGFFKPLFHRFRPTHHPDFSDSVKTVLNYRGGKYGFISGHAANAFGFATFMAGLFKNKLLTCILFLFAIINAYSRVYLGVHFISDIVAGALVGIIIGYSVYQLSAFCRKKFLSNGDFKFGKSAYSKREIYFLCLEYPIIVIILLVFNNQLIKLFPQ
jgi:undecaprenyl-diphosphatase